MTKNATAMVTVINVGKYFNDTPKIKWIPKLGAYALLERIMKYSFKKIHQNLK